MYSAPRKSTQQHAPEPKEWQKTAQMVEQPQQTKRLI